MNFAVFQQPARLDAAKSQLATAIRLYLEDCDPVSVHTLVMAAGKIIDRLCESKGASAVRGDFLAVIVPERRKEVGHALNKARNFFKHVVGYERLEDFSDDQNLIGIIMAVEGLHRLDVEMPEARIFSGWVRVVAPNLVAAPPPDDWVATVFGDIRNQPRTAQKESGRVTLDVITRLEKQCQRDEKRLP